ncbi:FAD-dependent oxidoreductase [Sphingomonas sp. HF-S4]|uniref:FAD-dependent oxidoreductase n=1 Tax=Sphingomonas agrestis TaxID=3080540 RepID=A0ABU3Y3V9_9SPHN|nr:FAD-dependent oxidoreductase [Sphingomonas sp. HF-S4]MDV3456085.1 FAD-dependent oxidoreductase [Sphingomonas sp. HF-S4]
MTDILPAPDAFEFAVDVLVIGGGGTGLCAALAAADAGASVIVVERDKALLGSTAMSTGLIPAAGTPEQAAAGIDDSPERFAADILAKTKGRTDGDMALAIARESAKTIAWMRDVHGVPLQLIDGFLYPGHSVLRMYGTPKRSGEELMAALESAANAAGIPIVTEATAEQLFVDGDGAVRGVRLRRPDGSADDIGCAALVLACSGFGGAAEMVARLIPEMAGATYHGHPGNRGDAVRWGEAMGAGLADMSAYQGHGGLAAGHGIPILWPLIMTGGFQANSEGVRFSNEALGYSEQAAKVNAQPGQVAWSIFDKQRHEMMLAFADYQDALSAGAIVEAKDVEELAERTRLPLEVLAKTLAEVAGYAAGAAGDPFGRDFTAHPPLAAPYFAARVTGALFHTQGGLRIDAEARVLREDGTPMPNLFAGGGAARGVSGDGAEGYMAGNGLLTATTLGRLAGQGAARVSRD